MNNINLHIRSFIMLAFLITACVEPYEGSVDSFEDVLVVDALITNETKRQEVLLSRSYRFEEDIAPAERGAKVSVITDDGDEFLFEETEPGKYLSIQPFAAEMNKDYSLQITTNNGKLYVSESMQLPVASTSIDKVYAERGVNSEGVEGMSIFVDSFDPKAASRYYRHEYEETFKIIAPFWSPFDAVYIIEGVSTYDLRVILREQEEQVCYGKNESTSINLKSTVNQSEDRLQKHRIRFIDRDNYILSYRYSILVKQFVQTPKAFSYYETLRGLSQSSTNVFSEDQPGFLAGNVFSVGDSGENVAGFFEVTTVAEKRLFFDYDDFFPGEELPPYIIECSTFAPSSEGTLGTRELVNLVREGNVRFYDFNFGQQFPEGEFLLVKPECGDCTTLGSNVVPDFWIE